MIPFKPRLDVNIEKIASDDHGRYILAEIVIDNTKSYGLMFMHQTTQTNRLYS